LRIPFTLVTRLLQELKPLLREAPDGKRHLPGSGIHIRILNRDFVAAKIFPTEEEYSPTAATRTRLLVAARAGGYVLSSGTAVASSPANKERITTWGNF
jgi:hypothetical protein